MSECTFPALTDDQEYREATATVAKLESDLERTSKRLAAARMKDGNLADKSATVLDLDALEDRLTVSLAVAITARDRVTQKVQRRFRERLNDHYRGLCRRVALAICELSVAEEERRDFEVQVREAGLGGMRPNLRRRYLDRFQANRRGSAAALYLEAAIRAGFVTLEDVISAAGVRESANLTRLKAAEWKRLASCPPQGGT